MGNSFNKVLEWTPRNTFERDYKSFVEGFAKGITRKKILDVGCGRGDNTEIFAVNENEVLGTDVIDRIISEVRSFSFILSRARELNCESRSFDVVVSFDVIEHVEDNLNFLSEIYRVLKPGGKVILSTPNRNRLSNILRMIISMKKVKYPLFIGYEDSLGECVHLCEYTAAELREMFRKVGFTKIKSHMFWFGLIGFPREWVRLKYIFWPFSYFCQYIFIEAYK